MIVSDAHGVAALNERSREIFRHIVDAYVETGEPVGSRTIARKLKGELSPATIRNVMADLEYSGLLYAPHTSAGRLPTEAGLRMFVSGLLQVGGLDAEERKTIDAHCQAAGRSSEDVLAQATGTLAGLAQCASLVLAPKAEAPLKHIEFVNLKPGRALVVMVNENGVVENRLIEVPADLPPSTLIEAGNFLAAHLAGKTIAEARTDVLADLESRRAQLDELTAKVVKAGLATWAGPGIGAARDAALIIKGQSNLLNNVTALEDLDSIRHLFTVLEAREQMVRVLDLVGRADGVQIFIGAQNELFGMAGCSMVVAPFQNAREQIVGAIGVIGPTRLNYARIIPMVDYTARLVGRMLEK
ncbi:MAG: heat-inducible transcriptional repressor HrcA [Rhodospirillaceae bacterium]|nr:heat-inducible transcriptional repressor HrcA [Rhodospirillaceae bacterium]